MNRRMYFILPDAATARNVERDLLLARLEESRMHFLGQRGTDMLDLPVATPTQKTDLVHGAFIGLIAGSLTGALAGLFLYFYPEVTGLIVKPVLVLICAMVGAGVGIWVGGFLIGSSTPNIHLTAYDESLQKGHILLMLDVPVSRITEVRDIIKSHFPKAEDHGIEPTIPAFP